jgi:uncharacterized membrane protein
MAVTQYVAVRSIHVLGSGFVIGGSAVLWLALRVGEPVSVRLFSWFEAGFWAVLGVMVFTGLGNLVGFGVPTDGVRASAFSVKLACILLLAAVSVVRALSVLELRRRDREPSTARGLRWLYAATTLLSAVIVPLAGVLARG